LNRFNPGKEFYLMEEVPKPISDVYIGSLSSGKGVFIEPPQIIP
jgi:hypothetical protein